MRVAIVGAGVGGLTLAQGLADVRDIEVSVYERDPSPQHRRQGYRIHIDATGEQALRETLPAAVHHRVVATSSRPADFLGMYDEHLVPQFEQVFDDVAPDAINAVDRQAFRRALMADLNGMIEFGRELTYLSDDGVGPIELHFSDGTSATADLVVGADGIASRVRPTLVSDLRVVDTGVRCIYAKLPLTGRSTVDIPGPFLRGFCFVTDGMGRGAGFGPVRFRRPPDTGGSVTRADADYLMTVLTSTLDALGRTDEELFELPARGLWDLAIDAATSWHPDLRKVLAAADGSSAFPIVLRSCTTVGTWRTRRVTLLGDAIHPMSPAAGAGANTALWDAAHLSRALRSVAGTSSGKTAPPVDATIEALARYEQDMRAHGQAAVDESWARARQLFEPASSPSDRSR